MIYRKLIRPLLFKMEPEAAHEAVVSLLEAAGRSSFFTALASRALAFRHPSLETEAFGLRFPNPVGLAAGFDKDCRLSGILPSLGFGFLELGTVTPRPQEGNPRPRIFRIPEEGALVNRLGFNSRGAESAAEHLSAQGPCLVPVGINLGMNGSTPLDRAEEDYVSAFKTLYPYGDYFVVNVSSPNTPGLRDLAHPSRLARILSALEHANRGQKPLLVKLSPDIRDEGLLQDALGVIELYARGLVVSNTTLARPRSFPRTQSLEGGLSGRPLRAGSTELIRKLYVMTSGRLPIIGVGGIFTPEDAYEKLAAGACLVQVYTGLVYEGPSLVKRLNLGLAGRLKAEGLENLSQLVGRGNPLPSIALRDAKPARITQ